MTPIQFYIPRVAATALPIETVKPTARAAGVEHPTLEYSAVRGRVGELLITCRLPMARFLIEQLRVVAGRAKERNDEPLVIACAKAVDVAMRAIEEAPHDDISFPARGVGPGKY